MALTKDTDGFSYGDAQSDIREYLIYYSAANDYTASHFADAVCVCGGKTFRIAIDDDEGAAVRLCTTCNHAHAIGDSSEYLDGANLGACQCPCGSEIFEVTVGVSLYDDSEDVKWLYIGLRCISCTLTGCYGDWKNEYIGYKKLLQKV